MQEEAEWCSTWCQRKAALNHRLVEVIHFLPPLTSALAREVSWMPSVWADFACLTKEMQNFGGQRFLHIILTMSTLSSKLSILRACSINNFTPLAPWPQCSLSHGTLTEKMALLACLSTVSMVFQLSFGVCGWPFLLTQRPCFCWFISASTSSSCDECFSLLSTPS